MSFRKTIAVWQELILRLTSLSGQFARLASLNRLGLLDLYLGRIGNLLVACCRYVDDFRCRYGSVLCVKCHDHELVVSSLFEFFADLLDVEGLSADCSKLPHPVLFAAGIAVDDICLCSTDPVPCQLDIGFALLG